MKILTVDIGTGTQDIFLYESSLDLENGYKLVLPSPTMMIHRQMKMATRNQQAVLLTGVTMGGGPSSWAVEEHARAGLPIFATPDAARTLNDDLAAVQQLGVQLVSEDEAARLPSTVQRIQMRDFDFTLIRATFERFGVSLDNLAAAAVAVFDHGAAPADVSDRQFRFDYLDNRIQKQHRLEAFAFPSNEIPADMTRLRAVAASAGDVPAPVIVMDTAPAAVLGALFDPRVAARQRVLIANIGNFHTLAFRLNRGRIEGVFEHHTGLLDATRLERLLLSLADGTLTHAEVFDDHGHGALVYASQPLAVDHPDFNVAVTGPRRNLLRGSRLKPYFAVPFGDMMIAGCFGLLASVAHLHPELAGEILRSLESGGSGTPPWEAPA